MKRYRKALKDTFIYRFVLNLGSIFNTKDYDNINIMSCPIKNNSNTIVLTVHTSCYWSWTFSVLKEIIFLWSDKPRFTVEVSAPQNLY